MHCHASLVVMCMGLSRVEGTVEVAEVMFPLERKMQCPDVP